MSKAQFVQRRDGRVAALQFLYAWSINEPVDRAVLCASSTTFPRKLHVSYAVREYLD
jgi:transcription termination factor NusB